MNPSKLNFGRDVNGYNAYAPVFSTDNFSVTLTPNNDESFTVPSTYKVWVLVFSPALGMNFWAANNDTAELPAGSTFAATTSQQNPSARTVEGGDVISVISEEGGNLGVSLYAVA